MDAESFFTNKFTSTYTHAESLHDEARRGNLEKMQRLLHDSEVPTNEYVNSTRSFNGDTPLHAAVRSRRTDAVKFLISAGANVNARNRNMRTPLHMAALAGGYDLAEDDSAEEPARACAVRSASEAVAEIAAILIEAGAAESRSARDVAGNTPLHLAAARANHAVIKELLRERVTLNEKISRLDNFDLDAPNSYNETPLILLLKYQRPAKNSDTVISEIVNELVGAGATVAKDENDGKMIHRAVRSGNLEVLRLFLASGANPNSVDRHYDDKSALAVAFEIFRPLEFIRTLVDAGAKAFHAADVQNDDDDEDDDDKDSSTYVYSSGGKQGCVRTGSCNPLHYAVNTAAMKGAKVTHDCISDFVLNLKMNVNAPMNGIYANRGYTPLHMSCQALSSEPNLSVGRLLVSLGADVNAKTPTGLTPLLLVSSSDSIYYHLFKMRLARLLLSYGADVGSTVFSSSPLSEDASSTALHRAVRSNNFVLADVLCQNGADTLAEDSKGRTPLMLALELNTGERSSARIISVLMM